jgi:multidrug resistance protein, MATE family
MTDVKTNSQRYKRILLLAGPLIGAMVSQNLLNLVDTFMIGKIGTAALAAVAAGGIINWLAGSTIMSLSTGVQQLAARRFGEENHRATAYPLNAGLITAVILGIPIGLICSYNAEHIMALITGDKEVIQLGAAYLSVTFLAVPFNGINFCFRGYWSGVNKQKTYMLTLFFIHTLNIILNYCLIFGEWGFPQLGVTGAALATMISISCGSLIYFAMAFVSLREHGFAQKFPTAVLKSLLKLSVPNAIQAFLYALSYSTLYKIIAVLGTKELAVSGVIINFALVCYLPGMALGLVATSLVGQALGKNDPEDADLWARQTAKMAALILGVLSLPFIFFPGQLLAAFIVEKDTIRVGVTALSILGLSLSLEGFALVMQYSLLGAGESRRVMYISTGAQWLVYLPIAWFMGYFLNWRLNGIWAANILTQILLVSIFSLLWLKGHWKKVKI